MIRRYSAKSKEELLLMMWIDINQDYPVSYFHSIVEMCENSNYDIISTLNVLDAQVTLWREGGGDS